MSQNGAFLLMLHREGKGSLTVIVPGVRSAPRLTRKPNHSGHAMQAAE